MMMVLPILFAMAVVAVLLTLSSGRTRIPHAAGDWGSPGNSDPRVAAAAMMYAVANEDGPVNDAKNTQMRALLTTTLGLTPEEAQVCLASGKRLAQRLSGSLNSRLHQLRAAIERSCSPQEKQDVVDMLRAVAGRSAERVPSVREALGRIAASLLHG